LYCTVQKGERHVSHSAPGWGIGILFAR